MFTRKQIIEMIYHVNGNISKQQLQQLCFSTLKYMFSHYVKWKFENNEVVCPDGRISDIHQQFDTESKKRFVDKLNERLHNHCDKQIWMPFVDSGVPKK